MNRKRLGYMEKLKERIDLEVKAFTKYLAPLEGATIVDAGVAVDLNDVSSGWCYPRLGFLAQPPKKGNRGV